MTLIVSLLILLAGLSSCSTSLEEKLKQTTSWGYQLQSYAKPLSLGSSLYRDKRMWVLDPDFDGQGPQGAELSKLKKKGALAIGYLSIGEAESYRDYFAKMDKSMLLKENPQWKGNFKVKYWMTDWQKIIFKKVDALIDQGFQGAYLDIVDGFYYFKDKKLRANQMVSFIASIRERALLKTDEFLIIQQNAPTLYQYTDQVELLFSSVDGLALEDAFFFGDSAKQEDNAFLPQDYALEAAKVYLERKKKVFSVEYLKDQKLIKKYAQEMKKGAIVPLVANRRLDGPLIFADSKTFR